VEVVRYCSQGAGWGGGPLPTGEQEGFYFSSIDYINRPAGRPYLARDPYLLKTLNKLLTDNFPR
jgi:hypothetical protein